MDDIFRALDDPSRRLLLDRLYDDDGQSLGELCRHLPEMTRFGVMNHLRVLEEAGLVTTARSGRRKLHYLNPVPIRLVHDRWIDKFTEPWVGAVTGLKTHLEQGDRAMPTTPDTPSHVYEAYIACTAEAAWRAVTDGEQTVRYFYGTRVESDWEPGAPVRYLGGDGSVLADGEVLAVDPPARLEMMFHPRWDPELEKEGPVRTVWALAEKDGVTTVRVEYYDLDPDGRTIEDFRSGIPFIVSGMKTLLETGSPLVTVGQ